MSDDTADPSVFALCVAQALVIGKGATYAFAKADELYGVAVYPDVEKAEDALGLPEAMECQHRHNYRFVERGVPWRCVRVHGKGL